MYLRLSDAETKALPGEGGGSTRRRAAMTRLAERPLAPGLIAFMDNDPVGWIAVDSTMSNRRMERTLRTIRAAAVVEQVVQGTGQFGVLNKDGFFTNVMMREFREDIEDEYEFDPDIK